jgi:iterative type I PKS product template protein
VIAEVLTLKDCLDLVANRARLMALHCEMNSTGMMAVNAKPAIVGSELRSSKSFAGLSISCFNSPINCVVSGPLPQLHAFKGHLDREVRCKNGLLDVPFGYHSDAMDPLLCDLTLIGQKVTLHPPSIPVISTLLGEVVMAGDKSVFVAEYFARHCSEPVQFDMGIRSLVSAPGFGIVDAWVEIGPHPTSIPMLKANTELSNSGLFLASLRKQEDPWLTLVNSLSQLYGSNVHVHWRKVFAHLSPTCCHKLPSYPFAKTKFWVPFKEDVSEFLAQPHLSPIISDYRMLHSWVQYPSESNGNVAIFEAPISHLSDFIRGHSVGGVPLCPVSAYLELIFAGINLAMRHSFRLRDNCAILRGANFIKPLVYDERIACVVKTNITLHDGFGYFSISSLLHLSAEEVTHVQGNFSFQSAIELDTKFSRKFPVLTRRISEAVSVKDGEPPDVFSTRTVYGIIFPRVVEYARGYHTIQSITVNYGGMEGYAIIKLPRDCDKGKYVVHPVFVDTLIHVAGFVANLRGGANDAYICSEVASVKVLIGSVDINASYGVYCSNAWLEDGGVILAETYAVDLTGPGKIVAHIKGMHFRRVQSDRLKRGLSLMIGNPGPRFPAQQNLRNPASQIGTLYNIPL